MMNPYAIAELLKPKRLSRKQKRRRARRERVMRQIMVRFAGVSELCAATTEELVEATLPAVTWTSRKRISVPRSLRPTLGRYVAGARYMDSKLLGTMGYIHAQYAAIMDLAKDDTDAT